MPLSAGSRLGPYEILAPVGAGGMGEVYRARDPRLSREVAVKVLPASFTKDPDRLHRFEQEARAAGVLNHPNITAVYDIGSHEGVPYVVTELLEGETLRSRLAGSALPVRKALDYAYQIAGGLAAAHEKRIVHRDLKPENLFVTNDGRVKILDFGLAKLTHAEEGSGPQTNLQTATAGTEPGVVLGTLGYMSPEQVRGRAADARSDIFSFGGILYEMLSGKRAFHGDSAADTMSAILTKDPPELSETNRSVSPALERIVRQCLEKSPAERWQTAHDLAVQLRWVAEGVSEVEVPAKAPVRRRVRDQLAWAIAAVSVAVAVLSVVAYSRRAPEPSRPVRFFISAPANSAFHFTGRDAGPVAVSPDGGRLAFVATTSEGKKSLFVRPLERLSAEALVGTDGASYPFWSPDSRFLGFFADGKLKKIEASGGAVQNLCDAPLGRGGAWNRDGVIVFAPSAEDPLYRVSSAGGTATLLTNVDEKSPEFSHRWPSFLPDGRRFLYLAFSQVLSGPNAGHSVYAASLDSPDGKSLFRADSGVAYDPAGYLLFVRERTLLAAPFDEKDLRMTGEPFPVAEHVRYYPNTASAIFSASENGVLAYQAGASPAISQLVWFDRSGKKTGTVGPPGDVEDPRISPDGKRVAANRPDPRTGISNIWLHELSSDALTRFTFAPTFEHSAIWSPDGSRIAFDSFRARPVDIYQKALSGAGAEEVLVHSEHFKTPTDWSQDGRFLLYQSLHPKTKWDLWYLPLSGDSKPVPFLRSAFNELGGQLSPDGKWVAYTSDELGKSEVYVTAFPGPGGKWQVSTTGGSQPRWRRDGSELFYLAADRKLMASEVRPGSEFQAGVPRPLVETRSRYTGYRAYDVSADGESYLINTVVIEETASPVTVVLNWTAALKR